MGEHVAYTGKPRTTAGLLRRVGIESECSIMYIANEKTNGDIGSPDNEISLRTSEHKNAQQKAVD